MNLSVTVKLMNNIGKWMGKLIAIALVMLLVACSLSNSNPDRALVKKAIALQLHLAREQLNSSQPMEETFKGEIKKLEIDRSDRLLDRRLPTFHVQGTYQLSAQLSVGTRKQKNSPFEIYLQQQIERKTWRLLRSEAGEWLSYQL
ncbi:hypothetical protein [Roseofilum casamattae]|uniref:Lipoprotein n=1 Tax=Roseofilum casamattae BLCC-M143 TaxID=3022442 RepID=A0ABT7C3B7_9CYAN|nr:hypothetical protein [Roseofilum casamattae]MDJ1185239.1 hypothetical protein [Roseofilum casamattae BLCC-M143]